jgi:hypothetical protein
MTPVDGARAKPAGSKPSVIDHVVIGPSTPSRVKLLPSSVWLYNFPSTPTGNVWVLIVTHPGFSSIETISHPAIVNPIIAARAIIPKSLSTFVFFIPFSLFPLIRKLLLRKYYCNQKKSG